MAEPLGSLLAGARSRWIIGGEGAALDHPLVHGQPSAEADLRLLAIAGQYQRIVQPPQPPVLNPRPDLPKLALPLLPDPLRPMARRLLQDKSDRAPLLLAHFAARRGYVLHPADWMPPPGAELPEVYRPLQLWQTGHSGPSAPLTSETWLDLSKADRLVEFAALRKRDPAAAVQLLSAQIATLPAEERLALVEALADGLTADDASFLLGLASDRSDKVRRSAAHLLARLGRSDTDPLASEAAAAFETVSVGFVRRRKVVRLIPKAKDGQLRSLVQVLPDISLQALAQVLGLDVAEFVDLWTAEDAPQPVLQALSTMIARTAADPQVTAWWQKLIGQPETARTCLPLLFPRFSASDQEAACLWLIAQFGLAAGSEVLTQLGPAAPSAISAALTADRSALTNLVRLSRDPDPQKAASARADGQRLASALSILGLLLTPGDAALALQTVTAAGVHPADPTLDRLSFNAALKGA